MFDGKTTKTESELWAEIERLRAVLQWIVDNTGCDTVDLYAYDIAREALASTGEQAATEKET